MNDRGHKISLAWWAGAALAGTLGVAAITFEPSSGPVFALGFGLLVVCVFCTTQGLGTLAAALAPAPARSTLPPPESKAARALDPEMTATLNALCARGAKIRTAKPHDHPAHVPFARRLATWLLEADDAIAKYGTAADALGFRNSKGARKNEARKGMYKPWGWTLDEFDPQYAWFCLWAESKLHTSLAA